MPDAFVKTMPPKPSTNDTAEAERLEALASYAQVDTKRERQFDSIAELARVLFDTPISAITLVDADRQFTKASSGIADVDAPREHSFCSHVVARGEVFVVPDATQDARFADNPLVLGAPHIRFYAGAPLRGAGGHNLGAVCVISDQARGDFSAADRKKLSILASIVGNEMELKKRAEHADQLLAEKDFELRDASLRIKSSLEYATLLTEAQSLETSTEKLAALAMVAWKQYSEAGGVLNASVKSLRKRMTAAEYNSLIAMMPGFAI
jgi:GAF domain-containing protein